MTKPASPEGRHLSGGHNADATHQATRNRLRLLGVSEMGIAQFGCLTDEQQAGISALVEQYAPNQEGNLRITEDED